MIIKLIRMLLILLIGNSNGPVNDLRKKPTRGDHMKALDCFIQRYSYIFIALFFLFILLLFSWVCFTFVGASVESGNYYYHLHKVI